MALSDLARVLAAPVQTVTEVIAMMQAIEDALPGPEGIGWFNQLYKKVTERVAASLGDGTFANPDYIARLDVVFANLYFSALSAFVSRPDALPRAWYPLFSESRTADIAPIQFAIAGMNAHINRDLPVAVLSVSRERNAFPSRSSVEKSDYDRLNPLLEQVETEVRAWFLTGLVKDIDDVFQRADTAVANFSLVEARAAAWSHADALWQLRDFALVSEAYLDGLDGLVGFASRGLLLRLGTLPV